MARIQFDAFVEDVKTDREGVPFVAKTAETHRRQDEQGEWKTVSRTFRDVKVSRNSSASLTGLGKGDRITVEGTEKTETREHDGKTFYTLVVWADSITIGGQDRAGSSGTASTGDWTPAPTGGAQGGFGDDTPF